jgi:hypothetical protein
LTWGAERALNALIECQVETFRFVARRAYGDLEFLRQFRHCTGWQEIAQLQQAWLGQCVADYGEEWGRLAGTSFQLAAKDFVPMQGLIYRPAPRGGRGNGSAG